MITKNFNCSRRKAWVPILAFVVVMSAMILIRCSATSSQRSWFHSEYSGLAAEIDNTFFYRYYTGSTEFFDLEHGKGGTAVSIEDYAINLYAFDGLLYYFNGTDIYSMNVKSGEKALVYEAEENEQPFGFYLYNSCLYIFNLSIVDGGIFRIDLTSGEKSRIFTGHIFPGYRFAIKDQWLYLLKRGSKSGGICIMDLVTEAEYILFEDQLFYEIIPLDNRLIANCENEWYEINTDGERDILSTMPEKIAEICGVQGNRIYYLSRSEKTFDLCYWEDGQSEVVLSNLNVDVGFHDVIVTDTCILIDNYGMIEQLQEANAGVENKEKNRYFYLYLPKTGKYYLIRQEPALSRS